jgi:hypothetical protein
MHSIAGDVTEPFDYLMKATPVKHVRQETLPQTGYGTLSAILLGAMMRQVRQPYCGF